MMPAKFPLLLSERLRPRTFQELILPASILAPLEQMAADQSPMNMLFYGQPGVGKTSAARLFIRDFDSFEISGGDKERFPAIGSFSTSVSLSGKPKACLIDEADQLHPLKQHDLHSTIELTSNNTRFLLTANKIDSLTGALKSRCEPICFDVSVRDQAEVVEKAVAVYSSRLEELGYEVSISRIRDIVVGYFPDLRRVANRLQIELAKQAA